MRNTMQIHENMFFKKKWLNLLYKYLGLVHLLIIKKSKILLDSFKVAPKYL